MSRNLVPKFILILVLVMAAGLTLFPPSKTLKPGIDLAGGTSLIYAIDTEGLSADEERDLAQRMITVLRRRIDPANIQNLVWRPQGNTRFEIQMPLASKETQQKRDLYLVTLNDLLDENINPARIMRALQLPAEQRSEQLAEFVQNDPNRLETLTDLASVYDERKQLQTKRDALYQDIQSLEDQLKEAEVDLDRIQANRMDWTKLSDEALQTALTDFLGSDAQLDLPTKYVHTFAELTDTLDKLTAESGLNEKYEQVKRQLDRLNLSEEQITYILELSVGMQKRQEQLDALKERFPDRAQKIDQVTAAFAEYSPFRGRLDDPADIQRMLKGAGILEFRILPTTDRSELSQAEIEQYGEALKEKGPKAASDNRYHWIEIEDIQEWGAPGSVVGQFGDKYFVLASNQPNEAMLRGLGGREWKLESAYPTTDDMGRRAIGFTLDIKGGDLFYNITSKNPSRPLAILLDDIAISAPQINPENPIRERGIITGSFSQTQVLDMVNKLNAGSLPARLIEQPISERVIGPSIGADNRDRGIKSGIIGLALVMVFMLVYYMIGGAIADAALVLNILFVLGVMAGIRATFTLPGIAGLILTIGMSVDANVLIFERIREEQAKGIGLATAVRNGYQRAFRAIFDSNVTTILTAGILYYVASEDVKGFAIVLMLGIASSMFTAIFVTRVIVDFLVAKRIIKDRIPMLRLIHQVNVDWMGLRKVFFVTSTILVVGGLTLFLSRDRSKYDIEFTGGTSVQIDLKEGVSLTRQDIKDRIVAIGRDQGNAALQTANVYSVGEAFGRTDGGGEKIFDQYEITTTATNKTNATVTFSGTGSRTVETITAAIQEVQVEIGRELGALEVTPGADNSFAISTSRVNPAVLGSVLEQAFPDAQVSDPQVDEVVTGAIRQAFEGQLEIQQNLRPTIPSTERITDEVIDTYPELAEYVGGIRIETTLAIPATLPEIDQRMKDLRFRPDTQELSWYPYKIYGPDLKPVEPNETVRSFTFVSVEPEAGLRDLSEDEWQRFIANEKARVMAATERETSLPRVTQIDPFVGSEAKTRALISIVLSLAAIVGYTWLRFGSVRYGLAAIAALVHDVSITLGAVAISAFVASTVIGSALLIGDFRISGTMVAAFLTLIGYSLNDTIVVFDRIRENRRKAQLTPRAVTDSINQMLSRTIITSMTTFAVVFIMYIFGGPGLRGFNFAIGLGLIFGTYSSVAIAAPLLLIGSGKQKRARQGVRIENIRNESKKLKV